MQNMKTVRDSLPRDTPLVGPAAEMQLVLDSQKKQNHMGSTTTSIITTASNKTTLPTASAAASLGAAASVGAVGAAGAAVGAAVDAAGAAVDAAGAAVDAAGAAVDAANVPTAEQVDIEEPPEFSGPAPPRIYKICMFAWESLHAVAVGGVAPHLTELAAGLQRRGHEVHTYVRAGGGQKHYDLIDGVHVHRVNFGQDNDFVKECENMCHAMVHAMCETERFMNQQFDIVHAHDWLAAQAVINVKRNMNRNCVFTVHSTEYGRCGNNNYGGQSARIRYIEAEAIGMADKVIGVSGVLCDEIKDQFHFDWNKLRCVYNGINCLRYDGNLWDPAEIRSRYGVGPLDPMLLFVGRMATQKGPDILVDAIPGILACRPDAKFVLVGDGYMKEDLVRRSNELGIFNSVRFTGSMGGQNLVDLFKACDVVCVPSRNEPFGIVTLEAWAANKPLVVTKSGGPREFVWHENDGYVVDTNPDGIIWGVNQVFSNFENAKAMGKRGRVKAAFQFSWDKIAENTNNVYDEIMGLFPPPPPQQQTTV